MRRTWREAVADPRIRGAYGMIFFLNVVLMGAASEFGLFPIAWEGHLGGFVGGALAYIALAPKPRGPWG
jgi:membrane associated rhomboid family serine protease